MKEKRRHFLNPVKGESNALPPFTVLGFAVCGSAIEDIRSDMKVLSYTPLNKGETYGKLYRKMVRMADEAKANNEHEKYEEYESFVKKYRKLADAEKDLCETMEWVLSGDYEMWADRDPWTDLQAVIADYPIVNAVFIYSEFKKMSKKGARTYDNQGQRHCV